MSHAEAPTERKTRVAVVYNVDFTTLQPSDNTERLQLIEAAAEVAKCAAKVTAILNFNGYDAIALQVNDRLDHLPAILRKEKVTAVFNLVESIGNEGRREPEFPELLETMRIPYTGNGPAILKLAFRKDHTRDQLAANGLPVSPGFVVREIGDLRSAALKKLRFPLFVKPAHADASIGIEQASLVRDRVALRRRVKWLLQEVPGPALVEQYLPGREINVAIFPDPFEGLVVPTEIDFSAYPPDLAPIVTYNCKWFPESPEYNAFSKPAADRVPAPLLDEIRGLARQAFIALGGTSYGRVDTRLDADGRPHIIDVNPNNDLDSEAGLSIAARSAGYDYSKLVLAIMAGASLKENHGAPTHRAG
jgi:D-alanine-D-alanine ligase